MRIEFLEKDKQKPRRMGHVGSDSPPGDSLAGGSPGSEPLGSEPPEIKNRDYGPGLNKPCFLF